MNQKGFYEKTWPKDNLGAEILAHEVKNYRYHWHSNLYEINILLAGDVEFCRSNETIYPGIDDIFIVSPGTGHASLAKEPDTKNLVLQINAKSFRPFLRKGTAFRFKDSLTQDYCIAEEDQRLLRFHISTFYDAACNPDKDPSSFKAKGSLELIIALLCEKFYPEVFPLPDSETESHAALIQSIITYIEEHYEDKITLEDLSERFAYNRTYISTIFKANTGINFYDYRVSHFFWGMI